MPKEPTKPPEAGHKHIFDKMVEKKVLLHNEENLLHGDDIAGGPTTGFDILKQRVCKCGAVETYDMERTKI